MADAPRDQNRVPTLLGSSSADDRSPVVVWVDPTTHRLYVTSTVSGSVTVTATDLDIRDLTSVSDSVAAVQSGTWNITNISGTVSLPTGAATSANQQPPVTTATIYNVTLTNANTEYSQALPANTREFRFRCRTLYDVRFAWVTGKVATPTAPYETLPAGMEYSSDNDNLASSTLYLASATAGVVVELETWTA